MEAHVDPGAFKVVLIVLAAAGVVIPLFHRLKLSPVLGYMLVGVAVGPFGLGRIVHLWPGLRAVMIGDPAAIAPIAELGVVMLLFMIGLELSFPRLWVMRRLVFGLGAMQLAGGTALLGLIAWLAGLPPGMALLLGVAGAMSSTAVVIQVLSDEQRLGTALGRACFAVLLFQDLAVVPVLLVLGLQAGTAVSPWAVALRAAAAVGLIVLVGRLGLRRLFRMVARTGSPELFMAACLLVVLGTAVFAASTGVSMALGALIGGLLLAGTEFRRQVEVTIEPFKGLLVGVFLIGIGMGFDPLRVVAAPLATLGGALLLILLKAVVVVPAARLFGLPWPGAVQAGLLLGPGGEFGFVVLSVAVADKLLPAATADTVLAAVALSMAAIPPLSAIGRRQAPRLARRPAVDPALLPPDQPEPGARVIIAGFGRVGQTVAAMLETHRIPYVAVDRDPDRVAKQRRAGRPIFWGDIAQPALLRQVGVAEARALVVTMDDRAGVDAVVGAARAARPDLLVVARARDAVHAAHLYHVGASDAVPETIEASLQLSEAVLVDIGVPMGPVIASIHERRAAEQDAIKAAAPFADIRQRGRRRLRDALRPEIPAQE